MKKITFLVILWFCMACACIQSRSSTNADSTNRTETIVPGAEWKDTDGNLINAHGGGILYHDGTYYWYGEYKGDSTYWNPKVPSWECYRTEAGGVSCYSSKDLKNWPFEYIGGV